MTIDSNRFDQMLRDELATWPDVVEKAVPLAGTAWWAPLRSSAPGGPRLGARALVAAGVIAVCTAFSLFSGSVSPLAWSRAVSAGLARCGTDFGNGHPLACAVDFFRAPAATGTSAGRSHSSSPPPPEITPGAAATPHVSATPSAISAATAAPTPTALSTPLSTPVASATPAPVDLIANSSFESGLSGWITLNSTLKQTYLGLGVAPDGYYVNRVTYTGSGTTFSTDYPNGTKPTTAGRTYKAVAWVRAAPGSTSLGKRIQLNVRERDSSGNIVGSAVVNAYLTSSFQEITISGYVTKASGGVINVYVDENPGSGVSPTSGDSFDVDNVELFAS